MSKCHFGPLAIYLIQRLYPSCSYAQAIASLECPRFLEDASTFFDRDVIEEARKEMVRRLADLRKSKVYFADRRDRSVKWVPFGEIEKMLGVDDLEYELKHIDDPRPIADFALRDKPFRIFGNRLDACAFIHMSKEEILGMRDHNARDFLKKNGYQKSEIDEIMRRFGPDRFPEG